MGNSKLNICLLLIVAGTAAVLGSFAKQEPPQIYTNNQEDERLPSNYNDYENKMNNGTAKRTLEQITAKVSGALVGTVLGASRTVTISVKNNSKWLWQVINCYLESGTLDDVIPYRVPPGESSKYSVRKGNLSPSGVGGVTAYYIAGLKTTLTIMFKVPNAFHQMRNNWWNVNLRQGRVPANKAMYKQMYENSELEGDNFWHEKGIRVQYQYNTYIFNIKGFMTNSENAALQIEVPLGNV